MSEIKAQTIKDVINMTPKLDLKSLASIKILMENIIDAELLRLEPTTILQNMDLTEKLMYLECLTAKKEIQDEEYKNSKTLEEIILREGLNLDDLQNKDYP